MTGNQLDWRCVARSGQIAIWEGRPSASRGRWVCYEVRNEATGEVRPKPERDCLLTFNEMLLQTNQTES